MKFSKEEFKKAQAEIIARAWSDEAFKKRLLKNPREVLKELGFSLPEDMELQVVENTAKKVYFVLPLKPKENLSEAELKKIAAAGSPFACYCD